MSNENIRLGRTEPIPTLEKHYRYFAHVHPMEFEHEVARNELFVTKLSGREIFGLYAPNVFGEQRVEIDVSGIKHALAHRRMPFAMYEGQLNQHWVDYQYKCGGCEEEGIARLKARDLRRPGIMIYWGGGASTLIDGSHRLVRRWRDGCRTFEYACIDAPHIIRHFLVPQGHEHRFLKNETNIREEA